MGNALARRLTTQASITSAVKKRVPRFAYDYFAGGVGEEVCKSRNRTAVENVQLVPSYQGGTIEPSTQTTIFGQEYSVPFGIAPVGAGDFIWPGAAEALARAASNHGFLFIPGTMTTVCVEKVRKINHRFDWFQLYVGRDKEFTKTTLKTLKEIGVRVLVLTVDMTALTYRWREEKHDLDYPPNITLRSATDAILHPHWTFHQLIHGFPKLPNALRFVPPGLSRQEYSDFIGDHMFGLPSLDGFRFIRDLWDSVIVVKGILSEGDLKAYRDAGADGAVISNHGGRQLDAAPTAIDVLPQLRESVGRDFVLLADGQCWTGLDVARYIAVGADFVLAGRAPYMSVAAGGVKGAAFFAERIREDFEHTLTQIGCPTTKSLPNYKK
ncbi:MAG: alpha-hydroxy acid oxidase [Pseudomonadota bacterium]